MIEMFVAVTIVLALLGVVLLALLAAPWWMTVLVVAGAVLLLGKLVNRTSGGSGKEGD